MRLITESALWWILFVFFFWISALVCMGYSAYLLWQALKPQDDKQERIAFGILLAAGAGVVIVTISADSSLVSMANLLKPLKLVSPGLIALAEWTNALGMVAVFSMVVSGALMLMPGGDANEVVRKLRCSTLMLYGGAALTVLWIVQSTAMYRFAGTLVEPVQRRAIWELAPTVALVIGALISLVLAVMYLSALLWLNNRYREFATGKSLAARSRMEARSPLTFLKTNWAEVAAVLTPMVPGVFQVVSGAFKQVV